MTTVIERRPRFRRVAVPKFELTARDIIILRIVAEQRFARSTHIIALIQAMFPGSSEQGILRRLSLLFHGGYLARPASQIDTYKVGSGSKPMAYIIGNAGIDILADLYGFRRSAIDWTAKARTASRGDLYHALEITSFMTALDVACRKTGQYRVVYFDELLNSVAPPEMRANAKPYSWPVTVRFRGKEATLHPIPDKTFAIQNLEREPGRNRKFYWFEEDTGTMPVCRADLNQTSILRKLVGYAYTYQQQLHTKNFGFSNIRVLTLTSSRERVKNMIDAHRRYTAAICPPGLFLFADRASMLAHPDLLSYPWTDASGNQRLLTE